MFLLNTRSVFLHRTLNGKFYLCQDSSYCPLCNQLPWSPLRSFLSASLRNFIYSLSFQLRCYLYSAEKTFQTFSLKKTIYPYNIRSHIFLLWMDFKENRSQKISWSHNHPVCWMCECVLKQGMLQEVSSFWEEWKKFMTKLK